MDHYRQIIAKFNNKRILVIGDIVLDQYIRGSVSRISPEAPVPVILQKGEPIFNLGGAANVANNLRSLGASVTLVGKIGQDLEGKRLLSELKSQKIVTAGVVSDRQMPTIVKTRIYAEHQQVARLDREKAETADDGVAALRIQKHIEDILPKVDAVIISDYGKGVVTRSLVEKTCSLALSHKKVITVDPKVEHFSYYSGVTCITPNRKEAENAIQNIKITQSAGYRLGVNVHKLQKNEDIDAAGTALVKYLNLQSLLMTLGEQGMRLFEKGKKPIHINTKAQEVYDVSGAGDTVISVFTLSLTAGATKHEAADLANYAAGIVVGKAGVVTITKQELLESVKS